MPFTVHCPSGHAFLAPESFIGREVRCPFCHQPTIVGESRVAYQGEESSVSPLSIGSGTQSEGISASVFPGNQSGPFHAAKSIGSSKSKVRPQRLPLGSSIILMLVAASNALPGVLAMLQGDGGPWPFVLVGVALLELGAALLFLIFPDWDSLKMTGFLFGAMAALLGMAAAFLAFASKAKLQSLAIASDWQDAAARWMISLSAVQATTAFFCFRAAETWRRRTNITLSRKAKQVRLSTSIPP
ncbi:MAG: hypothetical protein ACUVQR_11250 [Thermogutta sp.]